MAFTTPLFGKLLGGKGYLGQEQLQEKLRIRKVLLLAPIGTNMKNRLVVMSDQLLLRKRVLIESIRRRSPASFTVRLLSDLIASPLQPKKPSCCRASFMTHVPSAG